MIHRRPADDDLARSSSSAPQQKLTLTYPASTGRNSTAPAGHRLAAAHRRAPGGHPADWKQGEDVIIVPTVSDEEAKQKFPRAGTPEAYLRLVKQPS